MNQFTQDDLIGRQKFKQEFGNYYIFQDTNQYDHTDLFLTACTKTICYNVEIKNRHYPIEALSGGTYLEQTKLDYFKQVYRQDCHRCIIYFNWYEGGWIAFDITNRLNFALGLDKVCSVILPCTTSVDNGSREKQVISLAYSSNMYLQDKMHVYPSISVNW